MTTRILFVCHGNICRSPMAEGMFRHLAQQHGRDSQYFIDSAGTHAEHIGEPPDRRMQTTARRHGVVLGGRARQVSVSDLDHFDLIIAMDRWNLRNLERLARDDHERAKIRLLRHHDPTAPDADVPDPWYGGPEGFEEVYDMVERSCTHLLNTLETQAQRPPITT